MATYPVNEKGYRIGEAHPKAKLSDEDVDRIREYREDSGKSYGFIAMKFHISRFTVRDICTYRRRAQTPFRWVRIEG